MKKTIYVILSMAALSSCSIYRDYQRPEGLPTDSLYRDVAPNLAGDSLTLGDLSWREMFKDPLLRDLIEYGLENNTDMKVAFLRVDQARAQLTSARLAFLPSVSLSPQGTITRTDGAKAVKSYEIPLQASWEIDLFGKLRNAKQEARALLVEQEAYKQAIRSELIASIANSYYTLLTIDEQISISLSTLEVWEEQVRMMESKLRVGEETENAVTQARASLYELRASHNDLLRQAREAENTLCTLLGETSRTIERSTLAEQVLPDSLCVGVPLRLLSRRPDVVQAEAQLASAYYSTNQARSAFYPNLVLSGSVGWTNSLGEVVSNPGGWILSAIASLTQPIFQRGELISNLKVSKAEEEIAQLNYKQALLDAGQEVNDALYAAVSASRDLEFHQKQQEELERSVVTAEALYRAGEATYLDVLTARQSLLSARLSVASDQFTRLSSIVNLYNALGGGAS